MEFVRRTFKFVSQTETDRYPFSAAAENISNFGFTRIRFTKIYLTDDGGSEPSAFPFFEKMDFFLF